MFKRITKRHLIGGGTALVIMIVAFAVICGAWRGSARAKPVPLDNAAEIYAEAAAALKARENIYYQVEGAISATIGTNTLEENFTQLITIEAPGTEQMRVCVEETRRIGSYNITRFSFYADGKEYLTVQGASFQAAVSADEFNTKLIPSVLIDPTLYVESAGITVGKESTISFTKPAAIEVWAAAGAEPINAESTAFLNKDGALTSSVYTATYKQDGISYTVHYTVKIIDAEVPPIQLPDDSAFTPINAINTPYLLEKACGYLMNISSVHAQYKDTIACEAFGDERSQAIQIRTDNTDGWRAQVDTSVSVSNSSKAGAVTTSTKSELFSDNTYSASTDGAEFVTNSEVDLTAMTDYCHNLLIGTVMHPQYIISAEMNVIEDICSISFQASEDFAQILAEEACTTLYQSPLVLSNMSESSATDTATCYLNINKTTGFPVSAGFNYQGTYTISGIPYRLTFRADQTYAFSVPTTPEENTEAKEAYRNY